MDDIKTDIHSTLGFLNGVLVSIQLAGKHLHDPEVALERILESANRGLNQYELYEKTRGEMIDKERR